MEEDGDTKKHKRFRIMVNKWDSEKQVWEESDLRPSVSDTTDNRHIIYRRMMDKQFPTICIDEECEIPLKGLNDLLQSNMKHVESARFEMRSVTFNTPFAPIIYNWNALEKASEPTDTDEDSVKDAREDLRLLLDNIRISEPGAVKTYFKDREANLRARTVTFGSLWTLFQPGTKVLAKPYMDEWQMFEVNTNWWYGNPPRPVNSDASFDNYREFHLSCTGFDWDGKHFRKYTYRFKFEKFEGTRPIRALQCFPVEYWEDDKSRTEFSKLREQLIKRGEKFTRLSVAKREDCLWKYSGLLLYGLAQRVSCLSIFEKRGVCA